MNILGKNVDTISNFKSDLRQLEEKLSNYKSNPKDWYYQREKYDKKSDDRTSNFNAKIERSLYRPMNNEELYETIEKADPSFIYNEKNLFSNDKLSINYLNDTNNLKNAKFNSNDYYSNSKPTFNKDERNFTNQAAEKRKSAKVQPNSKPSTIINANSWKDCEVLVNEHYKRIKHEIINDEHRIESPQTSFQKIPVSSRAHDKLNNASNKVNEKQTHVKPEKSHLIYDESPSAGKNQTMNRSVGYNQNEIRQYIELKKNKRIELSKSEKEKMKIESENHQNKIQAILRKQRESKIRKEKNSNDYNIGEKQTDQSIDKNYKTELDKLLQNNFEFIREKYSLTDTVKPFELIEENRQHYKAPPVEKPSFNLNKHERLKNICNLAIDLQAKLQETSVNVFQLSTTIEKENLNENYLLNRKLNNEAINDYLKKNNDAISQTNNFILPEKKLFSTSFPSTKENEKYFKQMDVESSYHDDEPEKPISTQMSSSHFQREDANVFVEKLEKPNWENLESDNYSFFILAKNKLKTNISKIDSEKSVTKEATRNKSILEFMENEKQLDQMSREKPLSFIEILSKRDNIEYVEVDEKNYDSSEENSSVSTLTNAIQNTNSNKVNGISTDVFPTEHKTLASEVLIRSSEQPYEVIDDFEEQVSSKKINYVQAVKTKEKEAYIPPRKDIARRVVTDQSDQKDYSPATLERMLNAGLNYLENISNSTIQLEELDKVRCIGLAQNENVVLAHFLRNQQLEKDIIILKEKSANEVNTTIKDNRELLSEIQSKLKNFEKTTYNMKQKSRTDDSILSEKHKSEKHSLETSTESFDSTDTIQSTEQVESSRRIHKNEDAKKGGVKAEVLHKNKKESDDTISTETFEDQDSQSTIHTTKNTNQTQTEDRYDNNRSIDSDISFKNKSKGSEKHKLNKNADKPKQLPLIDSESENSESFSQDSEILTEMKKDVSEAIEEELPIKPSKTKNSVKDSNKNHSLSEKVSEKKNKIKKYHIEQETLLEKREKELEQRRKRLADLEELISRKKKLDEEEREVKKKEYELSKMLETDDASVKSKPIVIKSNKPATSGRENKYQKSVDQDTEDIKTATFINKDDATEYSDSFATETKTNAKKSIKERIDSSINEETLKTEEDSISSNTSKNETITDQTEMRAKIQILKEELKQKKMNAAKLERDLKNKAKNELKEKEKKLKQENERYEAKIEKMKNELSKKENDDEISKSKSIDETDSMKKKPLRPINFNKIDPIKGSVNSPKKTDDKDLNLDSSQIVTHYEDDFSDKSEIPKSFSIAKKNKYEDSKNLDSEKDDMKSTTSEVSDNFKVIETDIDSSKEMNDDSSNVSDSSTDTQILILGKDKKDDKIEKKKDEKFIWDETPKKDGLPKKDKTPEKDEIINFEDNFKKNESTKLKEIVKIDLAPKNQEELFETNKIIKIDENPKKDIVPVVPVEETFKTKESKENETLKTNDSIKNDEKPKLIEHAKNTETSKIVETPKVIVILEKKTEPRIDNKLHKPKPETLNNLESALINDAVDALLYVRSAKIDKLKQYEKNNENEEKSESGSESGSESEEDKKKLIKGNETIIVKPSIPSINLELKPEDSKKPGNHVINKPSAEFTVAGYTKDNVSDKIQNFIETVYWDQIEKKSGNLVPKVELNEKIKLNHATSFDEMLFDLSGEIIYDLYKENYEKGQPISVYVPGFQQMSKKQFFKNSLKGPSVKNETSEIVFGKVKDILNFPCKMDTKKSLISNRGEKKSKWRVQKRLDLVDNILDREMREEENEWSMYDQEEIEAKLMMSEIVFENILQDTVSLMLSLKKKS